MTYKVSSETLSLFSLTHAAALGFAVQAQLNGLRSYMGGDVWGPKEHFIRWKS